MEHQQGNYPVVKHRSSLLVRMYVLKSVIGHLIFIVEDTNFYIITQQAW